MESSDTTEAEKTLTIGDLREAGMRLGINCRHCHRFRYLNDSRFADATEVPDIAKSLKCARCGSTDVETLAVSRDPATGYWPAERS